VPQKREGEREKEKRGENRLFVFLYYLGGGGGKKVVCRVSHLHPHHVWGEWGGEKEGRMRFSRSRFSFYSFCATRPARCAAGREKGGREEEGKKKKEREEEKRESCLRQGQIPWHPLIVFTCGLGFSRKKKRKGGGGEGKKGRCPLSRDSL